MNLSIKNFVFYAIAIVSIVILTAWAAISKDNSTSNSNLSASANSALTIPEQSFDFDTTSMEKGKVSHVFEVKNPGSKTVTIEKVYTSGRNKRRAYAVD